MSTGVDPLRVAQVIKEMAATEILPRFGHLAAGDVREKTPGALVTEADTEGEKVLCRRLPELLPGSWVVGEEGTEGNPGLLQSLERNGAIWIVDPVDGTANFAKGEARFAVIVALVVDGATLMGWILDPLTDRVVIAEAGAGAWLGGQRLEVAPPCALAEMRGSARRSPRLAPQVAKVLRRGCYAHDYIELVTGGLHFGHFRNPRPWDHAAGVLIHAEAGGYGRLMDGTPYQPRAMPGRELLLAPSVGGWRGLADLLRE